MKIIVTQADMQALADRYGGGFVRDVKIDNPWHGSPSVTIKGKVKGVPFSAQVSIFQYHCTVQATVVNVKVVGIGLPGFIKELVCGQMWGILDGFKSTYNRFGIASYDKGGDFGFCPRIGMPDFAGASLCFDQLAICLEVAF